MAEATARRPYPPSPARCAESRRQGRFAGGYAGSWAGRRSGDRQIIEFTLRDNAKFAIADPINAQALKESCAWFLDAKGSGQLRVNRAMAWAVPYEKLLQIVTRGLAERSRSCVPNKIEGYVGEFWPYETNLDKAREEVAQAQVPDGFSVTMPVYADDLFAEESSVLNLWC